MALLEVSSVTKRFGGVTAVDNVSLEADIGTITALIGPNGAGKTTLFNIITGFDPGNEGRVTLSGKPIEGLKPWQIARLGMVRTFQTAVGFRKLSVWENLVMSAAPRRAQSLSGALMGPRVWNPSLREVRQRAEEVLAELDLRDRRDVLLEDLSVGETKLVEFARQLVTDPQIVLLDEPASGVNPAYIRPMSDLLGRLRERLSLLIIDHNLSFIMGIADYVYVLAAGGVIASGPPEVVARDPRVVETYLGAAA